MKEHMRMGSGRRGLRARAGQLLAVGVLLAGCDTKVTNPGPVQDPFLDRPEAQAAVVTGMGRALADGFNWIAYTGAAVTREIHPAGSTGSFGILVEWQNGILPNDDKENTHWNNAQRARWYAENGLTRMQSVVPDSTRLLAQANLWAGYANRLLGENMCDGVIDGGAIQDYKIYFQRAEGYFSTASTLGTGTVKTAALAGRASVRVPLDKWTEAVADAGQVPTSFVYQLPFYEVGSEDQRNRIEWSINNTPYRAHTEWNTVYEEYFKTYNDPRVKWRTTTLQGDAAIDCCGRVPFYPEDKYPTSASPVNLSSGPEMRLIEAEALLRGGAGNITAAMNLINGLRQTAGVAAWPTPANLNEAWTRLKRERGIVLWLEARRMGDMRRWKAANTPGDLDPLETPSGDVKVGSHLVRQDLCFPTPKSERDNNPNIS